jgi:ribosomal protein L18E
VYNQLAAREGKQLPFTGNEEEMPINRKNAKQQEHPRENRKEVHVD